MPHRNTLLLKRLSESDLTFFEFHFRRSDSNQKGINLNADVFVEKLYPALPDYAEPRGWKIPLDLWILGPGVQPAINLQRKIIKGTKYKNWRLNGEMVTEAETGKGRFSKLRKGDIVLMAFEGNIAPESGQFLFLAQGDAADNDLFKAVDSFLDNNRMLACGIDELEAYFRDMELVVADDHPMASLLGESDLELAVMGDPESVAKVRRRKRTKISWADLANTRRDIDLIGRRGEELVDVMLAKQLDAGEIESYEWTSDQDALAPWDFKINKGGETIYIDVKTTTGVFDQRLHISFGELKHMASEEDYRLYRVYLITEEGALLLEITGLKVFASSVIETLARLPSMAQVPSVICRPDIIGQVSVSPITIGWPSGDEDS